MGCLFALKGNMSIGDISVLLSFANKYTRPYNDIADVFADLQAAYASAVRVFNVLDMKNEVSDAGLQEIKRCTGEVDFENVDFSYTADKKLIQNLNLHVKKGKKLQLLGQPAAGKARLSTYLCDFTTLIKAKLLLAGIQLKRLRERV